MTKRQLKSVALMAALSTLVFSSAVQADEAQPAKSKHSRDPYLEGMLKTLQEHPPSDAEIEKLSKFIDQHPNDPDGHLVLAAAYGKLGMDGLYADELEKAWFLAPERILLFLSALQAKMLTNDHLGFDRLTNKAYELFKNDAKKLETIGGVFQNSEQNSLSLRFLARALELEPENLKFRASYCSSLLAAKQFKELLKVAAPLSKEKRTNTLCALFQGLSLYNLNASEKALPLLKQAYDEDPTRPELAEAYFDVLMSLGKTKEALPPALIALAAQRPGARHSRLLRSKLGALITRAPKAQLDAEVSQTTKLLPPMQALAFFYFSLADLFDKAGQIRQAKSYFAEGLSIYQVGPSLMRFAHDMEILGDDPEQVLNFYQTAALMSDADKEAQAKYQRMKTRIQAHDKDIAARLKVLINRCRYKS